MDICKLFSGGVIWLSLFSGKTKVIAISDLERWKKIRHINGTTLYCMTYFLLFYPEYRNLVSYRIRSKSVFLCALSRLLFRPYKDLFIKTKQIGAGLFIEHGFSTIIYAKRIGDNCWINQQVTIGFNHGKNPVIGDNVSIKAGAIIIGDIQIGDGAVIGAGAVVTHDVPEKAVVVGTPARVIKYID